jgi:DNA-binding response OmpR family regulator
MGQILSIFLIAFRNFREADYHTCQNHIASKIILSSLLEEWGFTVSVVNDGAEAWNVLKQEHGPDLAILDWMMPWIDGFEVCRKVRKAKGGPKPYLLLMTGESKKEEIIKVLVAGADDYLLKPFEPLDLKIRIRTATRIINLQADIAALPSPPSLCPQHP